MGRQQKEVEALVVMDLPIATQRQLALLMIVLNCATSVGGRPVQM
jgi:hypothetical protein